MVEWITPKTDWQSTDRFNYTDYNRIKNNISFLHSKSQQLWRPFSITEMGEDITSYAAYWDVDKFNAFEENIEKINGNILTKDYGYSKVFFENGPFIRYDELNRIELATLSMYEILKRQESGLNRMSFRLGAFKEVRI